MMDILEVTAQNRAGVVFDGQAASVSSTNQVGPFDILPRHTNFVSVIKEKVTIRARGNQPKVINIDRGVLRVLDNRVEIFIGL